MAKGKTNYTFTVNASQQDIHNLMQNFLSANGYQPNNEAGVVYYKYYDGIWGNRFLEDTSKTLYIGPRRKEQ